MSAQARSLILIDGRNSVKYQKFVEKEQMEYNTELWLGKKKALRSALEHLLVLRFGALTYFFRSAPKQKLFGRRKNSLNMHNNPLDIQNFENAKERNRRARRKIRIYRII